MGPRENERKKSFRPHISIIPHTNVGALSSNSVKEAPSPTKERVSTSQEETKSKEVLQETPHPVEVKPKTAFAGFIRRRIAKARPNIGALSNKSTKETPKADKEKVSPPEEEAIPKEVSRETSPPLKEEPKSTKETTSDLGDIAKEVSSGGLSAPESEQPVGALLPVSDKAVVPSPVAVEKSSCQEIYSVDNFAQNVLNITAPSDEIPSYLLNSPRLPISSSTTPTMTVSKIPAGTPPDTSLTVVQARTNSPIALPAPRTPSKQEYPTLNGILNSPRKRITTKKHNERRKRFVNGAEPPPRSEMTISDLIYFNPVGTAVTVKKRDTCTTVVPVEETTEPEPEKTEEEAPSGPQVMINEKGEIVLNEASLLVKRKDTVDYSLPVVIEDENTTYASFRNRAFRQWATKETTKFYKILKLVGTDFALMEKIFEVDGKVTRTRKELKCKYKREERLHTKLVHQAIYDTQTFEISILENESEEDPDDPIVPKKKTRGRRKKKDIPEHPFESSSANEQSDDTQTFEISILENESEEDPDDPIRPKKKTRGEDTSEVYHFPDMSKKSRKPKSNIVSSADESQGYPMEMICLSDKNVSNAVELPEHRTTEDNLCMDAVISEVLTTRRGRPKSKPTPMPSFSSFTPVEEEEPTILEEEDEEVLEDSSNESRLLGTTQNGELSEVEVVAMEVDDAPSVEISELDDRSDVDKDQIILTQASDGENVLHVFVVKSGVENEPHQS